MADNESITLSKREVFKKKWKQRSKTRRFPRVIGSNKPSSSKPRQSLLKSRFCCGYTGPSSSSGCSTPDEQSPLQQVPDFIMASSPSSSGSTSFDASFHSHENMGLSDHKSLEILMRTSSLRKPSFRFSKVKIADKPTCSSTIRNSKFPRNPPLKLGKSESDILQVYKVCPYHHCSLHGHTQDSSTSSKRHGMVRKSTKLKKNLKQLTETNMDGNLDSDSSNKSLLPPSGSEVMNTIATDNYEVQHTERSKEEVPNISNRKAPKQWSNLKKWILLQRFTKELERVRRLNKRKSRNLQVEPGLEAEKIHLRHQTVEEKKQAEEWMLDYALQQAMRELAPTQKRKVELLVKAFETMVPLQGDQNIQSAFPKLESDGEADDAICKAENLNKEASTESVPTQSVQQLDEFHGGYPTNDGAGKAHDGTGKAQMGNQNYIAMWHMVSQHVLSGIASNTKSALLDETDDESEGSITLGEAKSKLPCDEENHDLDSSCQKKSFNRDDAIKLVREAVNEILITQIQDDTFDSKPDQTHLSLGETSLEENELVAKGKESGTDNLAENKEIREPSLAKKEEVVEAKPELPKSNKWGKLKKLLILKRSIMALENARKIKFQEPQHLSLMPNPEPERVDLRHQIMNERIKAQQWMLDYAVQHIVTALTPARKRRVAMLVEAFEAVVPFPDNIST